MTSIPADAPSTPVAGGRAFRLAARGGAFHLVAGENGPLSLGPRDVLVRIKAASLNYRDLLVIDGKYGGAGDGLIPLSDGAGFVERTGAGVTRWRAGDRVAPIFFQDWISGPYKRAYGASALGGERPGVLSDFIVIPEDSLVRIPDHLSFEEAATLPCAAVTAWQALFPRGGLTADGTVLVQGTGGVALFALQFAQAVGARVIVLSSSNEKLARARTLGAWQGINYQAVPDWHEEVLRLTGGEGATHILELGGPETFDRSLMSLAPSGRIAQIGVLTGFGPRSNLLPLQGLNADVTGILVGSGAHFTAMNDLMISRHLIKPVIDRVFPFAEAQAAYDHLRSGRHFGKVVIQL